MAKILVVDDSNDLLEVFTFFLKRKGYEVKSASSKDTVKSALSVFIPDLILMDVILDGGDGRELCKEIKEKNKNIPIILISGNPEFLKDYEECKADAIIEKPFNLAEVTMKVNEVLAKYQQIESS